MLRPEGISRVLRVLIVKPSSLGDVVHALPLLSALRKCLPGAEIHWVIARGLEGLLEGHPLIHRLWVIDKDSWRRGARIFRTLSELRLLYTGLSSAGFDLAIDAQGLLRSGLITWASRARQRVGFSDAREGAPLFYNLKVDGGRDIHAVDRYMKLAGAVGCGTDEREFPVLTDDAGIVIDGDYAVLVPGARWKSKVWPGAYFATLAAGLGIRSVVVGGPGDAGVADAIAQGSEGRAVSMAGKTTLRQLAGIMRGARFVVTNDSGPMHIAAALGVPVFAIFGPTNAGRTGPYGRGHVIIDSGEECSPCYRRQCDDMKCMINVTPAMVLDAIRTRFP